MANTNLENDLVPNFIARLEAFRQGALLVVKHKKPSATSTADERSALITSPPETKVNDLVAKYKAFAEKADRKKMKLALAHFKQELAKELNISVKDIQRGEAYWAWQSSQDRKKENSIKGEVKKEFSKPDDTKIKVSVTERFINLPLTKNQKEELLQTLKLGKEPKWFLKRAKWEQEALKNDLEVALEIGKNSEIEEDKILNHQGWITFAERSIPATLKWLPIVGVSEHVLTINGQEFKGYRTSIPVPYDAKLKEQQRLTNMNMAQLREGLSAHHQIKQNNAFVNARNIMLVSLITGGKSEGWISYLGLGLYDWTIGFFSGRFKENNDRWVIMGDNAIKNTNQNENEEESETIENRNTIVTGTRLNQNITHYNFGINSFRSATPVKVPQDYIDSLSNATTTTAAANPFKQALQDHNNKIDKLCFYQKVSLSEKHDRNPNLFSAALIDAAERWEGGISAGHCKSTKDRKGIELLMADTIMVYQQLYEEIPEYDDVDEKRENFLDIACALYRTGVYADVAAFHSPGSKGLKDDGFTPKDLQKELADDYKLSKIQASWNKPSFGHISEIFRNHPKVLMAIGAISIGLMVAGALLSGPFAPLFLAGAAVIFAGILAKAYQFTTERSLQAEIDKYASPTQTSLR